MNELGLIIEKVEQFSITGYLEEQQRAPKFREFRFSGRDFLASDCPFQSRSDLPPFWVYQKSGMQFFFCDDCNCQGSVLNFFERAGYSPQEVLRLLGLKHTPTLEENLRRAEEVLFAWSDEGYLPSLATHDFVSYDRDKRVYYINWYPYLESPVYQRLKGKVLTNLWESARDIEELERDKLTRVPVEKKEETEIQF